MCLILMTQSSPNAPQTHAFQAEVQRVLHLVIHSLYSNKEIFLRELVSNASDALDKLRFASLSDDQLMGGDSHLRIELEANETNKTLTIRDNGIGMSQEELVANLGTIARSGTKQFLENLTAEQKTDANLIGQFGVGFYSGFIVASKMTVRSQKAGSSEAWIWESTGSGEFTLAPAPSGARGTEIVLSLKEGEEEFARTWRLENLVAKYSDHIAFPIQLKKEVESDDSENAEEADKEDKEDKTKQYEFVAVNKANALWTRPKSDLKDEDYQSFFSHLEHAGEALSWAHNKVEGAQSYTSLLYLPKRPPMDMLFGNREERKGLKLYVKRVFIMDAAEQLLPSYLRFVRGVVDSDDLPLNVSRELLQDNKMTQAIRASCIKRVLDMIDKLANDDDKTKYAEFFKHFGSVIKEGLAEDFANRERIAKLLRYPSTHLEGATASSSAESEKQTSFDEYIARMKVGQEAIYYITAESLLAAKNSPHLEALKAKGVEVLLMHDRIDEWVMSYLNEYAGKKVQSVAKGEINLDAIADGDQTPIFHAELDASLAARIRAALGDRVKDVRGSKRLSESASCLVVDQYEQALHLQRVLKAAGQPAMGGKAALEVNASHPLVKKMAAIEETERFNDLAHVLFEQAVLTEGGQLDDPSGFVKRMNGLLLAA
jgi:molecular chaperone HtpG